MKITGGPVLQVCDEHQRGYICKALRIVTGTQKVPNTCSNDSDYHDDVHDGAGDDGDSEGPVL